MTVATAQQEFSADWEETLTILADGGAQSDFTVKLRNTSSHPLTRYSFEAYNDPNCKSKPEQASAEVNGNAVRVELLTWDSGSGTLSVPFDPPIAAGGKAELHVVYRMKKCFDVGKEYWEWRIKPNRPGDYCRARIVADKPWELANASYSPAGNKPDIFSSDEREIIWRAEPPIVGTYTFHFTLRKAAGAAAPPGKRFARLGKLIEHPVISSVIAAAIIGIAGSIYAAYTSSRQDSGEPSKPKTPLSTTRSVTAPTTPP